ncbi:MAG: heavy metal-responsive transcriptional regulator [Candidatus Hydrogenedentes bacterium]|nr:heavy metal-responsive transcriptional regulator [Candidatus Hydrogenedentota bacterium]
MRSNLVTIGQLAQETGVTPRAIRHYETLGLIRAPLRTDTNYRLFDSDSMERVRFIGKCRLLGFSIAEIADLLRVTDDPDHTCAQVAELTQHHLELIDSKIQALAEMRETLAKSLSRCTGEEVPECAVMDFLKKPA